DGAQRRREVPRPLALIAVEPRRLHPRLRRADHVHARIIADVQHLRGLDAGEVREPREYAGIRFRRTSRPRGEVAGEQVADTAALEIRVAVAESEQRIARAQTQQRRTHIVIELYPVARGEKHLE